MSRYDGLIIPRSYSEYLNKTDSATLSQMLQHLTGLWSHAVSAGDNKPVTSDAVYGALTNYINKTDAATLQQALQLPGVLSGAVAAGDNKPVTSDAVYGALTNYINISAGKVGYIIIGDILINYGVTESNNESLVLLNHPYSNTDYTLIGYNAKDLSLIRGNKFPGGFGTSVSNSIVNYIAIGKI